MPWWKDWLRGISQKPIKLFISTAKSLIFQLLFNNCLLRFAKEASKYLLWNMMPLVLGSILFLQKVSAVLKFTVLLGHFLCVSCPPFLLTLSAPEISSVLLTSEIQSLFIYYKLSPFASKAICNFSSIPHILFLVGITFATNRHFALTITSFMLWLMLLFSETLYSIYFLFPSRFHPL